MRGPGRGVKQRLALEAAVTARVKTSGLLRRAEQFVTFACFGQAENWWGQVPLSNEPPGCGRGVGKDGVTVASWCLTQRWLFTGRETLGRFTSTRQALTD
jgi:hypothetical protein